ncbi:MAG: nitrogen regulation protein NR(II) [Candidatus Methylomirabilales bacterium]
MTAAKRWDADGSWATWGAGGVLVLLVVQLVLVAALAAGLPVWLWTAVGLELVLAGGLAWYGVSRRPAPVDSSAEQLTAFSASPPITTLGQGEDLEHVAAAFRKMIDILHEKEQELSRFYASKRSAGETLEDYEAYILDSISSGAVALGPDMRIAVFNRTAGQIFGYSAAEVLGKSCGTVFGSEVMRLAQEVLEQGRIRSRVELAVADKEGNQRWIGLSTSLLRDRSEKIRGAILLFTDLTEIRHLQEQVMLRESLATVGRLSAGIAHEVRNSLGAILGFANLIHRQLPAGDAVQVHVREIITEINAIESVLENFLSFARPMQLQLGPLELSAVVRETINHYREGITKAGITLVEQADGPLPVHGDHHQLRQAFGNLVRNAVEAMPDGGTLTVLMSRAYRGEAPGRGTFVEVQITDTGPGIDAEDRQRIFTPFFTTKEGGTGLGLALAQKTFVTHGGEIEAVSESGKGTTFVVRLPAVS